MKVKESKLKQVKKVVGRLNCPTEKIIKDKSKYSRKKKHKKEE